ncbi:VOC family protein [Verticiella sediminum]|uniref:VOC family protein n=1 Tax=Verticiella sediminum TaxID=1247510 RepID=A0A556AZ17_9BURK|nr:VOC family protein [Verticiella sediminum]TSH97685.1 VOC family protein [Verticiella sediminum]
MEQRVSVITLPVADVVRARAFYCEGLGWSPAHAGDGVVFFQCNGFVFALWQREDFLADIGAHALAPGYRMALAHNLRSRAEVDRLLATAEAAGARILRAAHEQPWGGYSGYFADPDDHVWEVAHNPVWPISPEGNVSYAG